MISSVADSAGGGGKEPQPQDGGGASSKSDEEVFQMRMELSDLRNRLKILDSGTDRCELLDLLRERDDELKIKNDQLAILNDKFQKITSGLGLLEEERKGLKESVKSLEAEKKKVSRHLNIREKEVMSLVKRCAEQEEKLQETVTLRVSHKELEEEQKEMKDRMRQLGEEMETLVAVRKELEESESARYKAIERCRLLEVQNKETSDGLLAIIAKLQSTQQEGDVEKAKLREEVETLRADLEREGAKSRKAVEELRGRLQMAVEGTQDLQRRLEESGKTIDALRAELTFSREEHKATIAELQNQNAAALAALDLKHGGIVDSLKRQHDSGVTKLQSEIGERDAIISDLRGSLAVQEEQTSDVQAVLEKERSEGQRRDAQQEKDIETLKSQNISLREQISERDGEIKEVKEMAEEYGAHSAGLAEERDALRSRAEELESELAVTRTDRDERLRQAEESKAEQAQEMVERLKESDHAITGLKSDLGAASGALEELRAEKARSDREKDQEIAALRSELEAARADLGAQLEESRSAAASLEAALAERDADATAFRTDLEEAQAQLSRSSDEATSRILSLQEELRSAADSIEKKELAMNELRTSSGAAAEVAGAEIRTLKDELERADALVEERGKVEAGLRKELSDKDGSIAKLQEKLRRSAEQVDEQQERILELTDVELRGAKEDVSRLEAEVSRLKEKMAATEMDGAEVVSDLEKQIEQGRCKVVQLEQVIEKRGEEHRETVASLEMDMAKVNKERAAIDREYQSQWTKLQKRQEEVVALEKKRTEQDSKMQSLRAELDLLIQAQERTKKDHASAIVRLELELDRERTRAEEIAAECEQDLKKMSTALSAAEEKVAANAAELEGKDAIMTDRTKLLSDMVAQNKELENDLVEARQIASDLQEESERYMGEKESAEMAVAKLQKELDRREEQFLAAMHKERTSRERLEDELFQTNRALENAKKDGKEYEELEKENQDLKDKVKRQEAYLRRKLEKEKMLRDRIMTSSTKGNVVPVPRPSSPPRKGRPSVRPSSAHARSPTRSRSNPPPPERKQRPDTHADIEEKGSFPDELDEILQDDV